MHDDVTGLILDGGQARRLGGKHKAFLELGGRPLAARTVELFSRLFPETLVATNRPEPWQRLSVRCVADPIENAGPLAGLVAGLEAASTPLVFVTGGDMPSLSEPVIESLLERARLLPGRAVVPRAAGRAQVLHAVYPRSLALPARRALLAGTRRLLGLLEAADTLWVEAGDLAGLPGADDTFRDVDTPEDLDAERRR
jgi:molybdopterin-guanine dinucleotide biosynthesis protein A